MTDANVVLGYLPPRLAGGSLTLDVEAARAAINEMLGAPLGLSIEAAAYGIREIANANMVRAIRAVTVERGLDPRELTLLAFGGSGPVHACDLARTLGITRVVFPPAPGVFTAMGMLAGSAEHHELHSAQATLDLLDTALVATLRQEMRAAATAALVAQGYAAGTVTFAEQIDLRLEGQDASLSIPFSGAFDATSLRPAFIAAYRDTYGYTPIDAVEAVALRLHAHARVSDPLNFTALKVARSIVGATEERRMVHFGRTAAIDTPILRRGVVAGGLAGPLIIEGADTTIVIPPGARVEPDATSSLVATLEAGL